MGSNCELTFYITPKSGPMRPMWRLRDAVDAVLQDVPHQLRRRPHWIAVKRLLLVATTTGAASDVRIATEAVLRAAELEGWMTRQGSAQQPAGPEPDGSVDSGSPAGRDFQIAAE